MSVVPDVIGVLVFLILVADSGFAFFVFFRGVFESCLAPLFMLTFLVCSLWMGIPRRGESTPIELSKCSSSQRQTPPNPPRMSVHTC